MVEVYFLLTGNPDLWALFLQTVTEEPKFLLSSCTFFHLLHMAVLLCLKSSWRKKKKKKKWRLLWEAFMCPDLDTLPWPELSHMTTPNSAEAGKCHPFMGLVLS